MVASILYIPVQIIRSWCKITKEYKMNNPEDEEDKQIRDKNYNHLICIAVVEIISFFITVGVVFVAMFTKNAVFLMLLPLINSVAHYFFLFYFILE